MPGRCCHAPWGETFRLAGRARGDRLEASRDPARCGGGAGPQGAQNRPPLFGTAGGLALGHRSFPAAELAKGTSGGLSAQCKATPCSQVSRPSPRPL